MTINVTKPYLPPFDEYVELMKVVWDSKQLTNNANYSRILENNLCEYLDVPNVTLFSSGTTALIAAIKCLDLKGEVITTPFSFIATTSSLLWNNIKPVFVDIEERTLNLDPFKVVDVINENTSGVLPVHCYGNPANVDEYLNIKERFDLNIIYDGAHSFGTECSCSSLLSHGDLSAVSFHATKVFNTFEGGAVISHTAEHKMKLEQLRNFGFSGTADSLIVNQGFNGKLNEMQAALGLLQLKYIAEVLKSRKAIADLYLKNISNITGIKPMINIDTYKSNYAYFPIIIEDSYPLDRDALHCKFKENGINVRKYFYPLIPSMPIIGWSEDKIRDLLPIAYDISSRIICLPIYPGLELDNQNKIISILHH
mgnify:CR=1 FL=1|tara:strand:+ start:213 stop:1316 length:1104 start_codon:yes stop_codon:yes gene_type:complete